MTKLYLEKSDELVVTRYADPDADYDADDTFTRWTFGDVHLHDPDDHWCETHEVDFDVAPGAVVHVVMAIWSTGNSFGNSVRAESEIMGIFEDAKEAAALQARLSDWDSEAPMNGRLLPWYGYFERLDEVEILTRVVKA